MAITRPPKPKTESVEAFISGAPDSAGSSVQTVTSIKKGSKVQVTLTTTDTLLRRIDQAAENLNVNRSAFINLCVQQSLRAGVHFSGEET